LPAGTIASAVGLNIELVRNDGIFTLDYEGENESTAIWTFESLQEVGQRPAMYASAATQTCITTFVVKGMQTVRKPLIDEKSESFLLSKGSKITSFLCEASNGDVWNVSTSGVEKRVRADEPVVDGEESTDETAAKRKRRSTRNQLSYRQPFARADTMPRFLFLHGRRIPENPNNPWPTGYVRLDRSNGGTIFRTDDLNSPTEVTHLKSLKAILWH